MANETNSYFDIIDNPRKAYWLGFLWCDGYVWYREKRHEYGVKLDLAIEDKSHLYKFKNDLGITTDIKQYKPYKSSFGGNGVCRCSSYNRNLVKPLLYKYGIVPHRTDVTKLLNNIPKEYERDFIRGCLDADGTFCCYQTQDNKRTVKKANLMFGGTVELLNYIYTHLKNNNIVQSSKMPKLCKRHKDRDGVYNELKLSGTRQNYNILNYLYQEGDLYLDRKYNKFQNYVKEGRYNERN